MATKATRDLALIMHFINNHEKVLLQLEKAARC